MQHAWCSEKAQATAWGQSLSRSLSSLSLLHLPSQQEEVRGRHRKTCYLFVGMGKHGVLNGGGRGKGGGLEPFSPILPSLDD